MTGCDAVVHLAAVADVDDVAEDPPDAESVNARGTLNVLEAARRAGVEPRRLRQHDLGLQRLRGRARRRGHGAARRPAHLYTATKLAGELYCKSYAELYGVEYTILRFGIPYGPRARDGGRVPTSCARRWPASR